MLTRLSPEVLEVIWNKAIREYNRLHPKSCNTYEREHAGMTALTDAQLEDTKKKMVEYIEKYVFYVDARGYIDLRPNATKNWQELIGGK